MYGHEIYPLGESGYGVSLTFHVTSGHGPLMPLFTFFHISDGFRQSLFCAELNPDEKYGGRASVCNEFYDRIGELLATKPHGERP